MKPERTRILSEGLVAGLLGYASIVLFYGVVNLVSGRSFFHTAAELGGGLVSEGAIGGATAGAVLAFNGVHLLAFLLIGVVVAWFVAQAEEHPTLFVLLLFIAASGFVLALVGFAMLRASIGAGPSLVSVAAANVVAAVAMAAYLFGAHPRLRGGLRGDADPETEHPAPR